MISLIRTVLPCLFFFLSFLSKAQDRAVSTLRELRGDAYYSVVSSPSNITAFLAEKPELTDGPIDTALRLVLEERLKNPAVFNDFQIRMKWCLSQFDPKTGGYFRMPGILYGFLDQFFMVGPESPSWQRYSLTEDGRIRRMASDRHFTDDEIERGKQRNRAARMAMLETLLMGMDNLEGYEQSELVNAARDIWIRSPMHKDEVGNMAAILDELAKSSFLHPIVLLQLGKAKYSQEELHEIYSRLLDDSMSPEWEYYCAYVKEALEFIKQNHPEELDKLETNLPWKRSAIDVARGLPYKEWRQNDEDQSEAKDAIDIEF